MAKVIQYVTIAVHVLDTKSTSRQSFIDAAKISQSIICNPKDIYSSQYPDI